MGDVATQAQPCLAIEPRVHAGVDPAETGFLRRALKLVNDRVTPGRAGEVIEKRWWSP